MTVVPEKDHTVHFDPYAFLAIAGYGKKVLQVEAKHDLYSQGDPAKAIFYLQEGRAQLTVVSKEGKEATISLLAAGDFAGEEAILGVEAIRMASVTAITPCKVLRIERDEMIRVMQQEHAFSEMFLKYLIVRNMRTQADFVDKLFSSSEKRLARILLMMAEAEASDEVGTLIPKITQESLAEMVGTTRSRVSFFMNRFRTLGFIAYDGRIRVHKSLANLILSV